MVGRAKMAKRARCASNNDRFLVYLPTTLQRKQYPWQSQHYTYLMRAEFGVVQLSNSIGHVFFAHKLYNSGPISVDVCIANVASFTHVVLQILPASTLRESWHKTITRWNTENCRSVFAISLWHRIAYCWSKTAVKMKNMPHLSV